jgi:cob(I)alamin adenosyltransferase
MRITRVYTRTGDAGETGLGGGQRVPKDHPRIEAYGTVDELNSVLGVVRSQLADEAMDAHLSAIQHQLFDLGGDLCLREEDKQKFGMPPFPQAHVDALEKVLDAANAELPPLKEFILPAGEPAASFLHIARCTCRRAERLVVALSHLEPVSPTVVPYLNRLSDALFQMARQVNIRSGRGDVLWVRTHKRGAEPATPPPPPTPPSTSTDEATRG